MTEYKNEKLETSFALPEVITVRMQMAYFSQIARSSGDELFFRLWRGATALVRDWQSKIIPDPEKLDLDSETNPQATELIIWAGLRVQERMNSLEQIPKN
jgi:hypothetical protein